MSLKDDGALFGPGYNYVMILLLRTLGYPVSINQPHEALRNGSTGYAILYFLAYIFVGIPIVYLELVIGQFTSRDCLDVWKIRKCVSHVGYFLFIWQTSTYIFNHLATTFATHYFLISFENPAPFYLCDWWSQKNCDIVKRNYTLNKYCLRLKHVDQPMCDELYNTMPEYQYFRLNVIGPWNYLGISWRLSVASLFICIIVFFSCFKRMNSLKWFVYPTIFYPFVGYFVFLIGSMRQKGIIAKFKEATDFSFHIFYHEYKPIRVITQVVFSVGAGTGVLINLSSNASFRLPCFANAVMIVLVTATFNMMTIFTASMMTCPYAKEYGLTPKSILKLPISYIFEMVPMLLSEYDNSTFYLIVLYSCQTALGLTSSLVLTFSQTQVIMNRYPKLRQYSPLPSLIWALGTFIFTLPLLGRFGYTSVMRAFALLHPISIFFVIIECLVFILWYGFDRLQQDVHFMLGTPPKKYLKICWALSLTTLTFAFFRDLPLNIKKATAIDLAGMGMLGALLGTMVLITIVKLIYAAIKRRFKDMVKLQSNWGPKNDVLLRSRGMFTAHAMTKEYIYRKYHLQAGIAARQMRANVRVVERPGTYVPRGVVVATYEV